MLDDPSALQSRLLSLAAGRYPDGTIPHGGVAALARDVGTSKQWAWITLRRAGFAVTPLLDRDWACAAPRCDRAVGPRGGKGFCRSHYRRFKRYGDPLGVGLRVRGANNRPAVERFLERVDFDGPGGCWLVPTRNKSGYATAATNRLRTGGRSVSVPAHRFMWWLVYGRCPAGELDHTCYRRNCINVAHLEDVTRRVHLDRGNEQRRRERAALRLLAELHPELIAAL